MWALEQENIKFKNTGFYSNQYYVHDTRVGNALSVQQFSYLLFVFYKLKDFCAIDVYANCLINVFTSKKSNNLSLIQANYVKVE